MTMYTRLYAILLVVLLPALGQACTLAWDRPTTYTDGSPVATTDVVTYRLYFQASGSTTVQTIAETDKTTVTQVCFAGQYWVTAYTPAALESAKSTGLTLKQVSPIVTPRFAP